MTEDEFKTHMMGLGVEVVTEQAAPNLPYPARIYYSVQLTELKPHARRREIIYAVRFAETGGTVEQAAAQLDWQGLYDKVCRKLQEEAA